MGPRARKSRITAVALVAACGAFMAASAIAGVTVYSNSFTSKGGVGDLRHAEGKHCDKSWRKKAKKVVIRAKKGRAVCGYRPPVEGDASSPNHYFQATEKLDKSTPKSVRDRVYLGVGVRSAKDTGYELWVFPTERKFKLARRAGSDKVGFLAKGKNKAIKGRGKRNVLGLKAVGSQLIAKVNGKRVAKAVDRNAGQVDGRKVEVMLGYKKHRSKPVSMTVDDLKLQVPHP
jgi:hypothetical protein